MKVSFQYATVIISGFDQLAKLKKILPSDIKVVPLLNPVMYVQQRVGGRVVQVALTDTKSFPPVIPEDIEELRNNIVENWVNISEKFNTTTAGQTTVLNSAVQTFLNEYYEEEIQQVIEETGVIVIPVPPEPIIPEGETVYGLIAPIDSRFLKAGGTPTLYVGTGIPGTKYSIAKNDLIELALTSFRRSQWDQGRVMSENTSMLTLANNNEQWNVTWSVGSKHETITNITELYDVDLIMYRNADGTETYPMIWRLMWDGAKYILRLTTDIGTPVPDVVDSGSDAQFRCAQNSTSLTWFKSVLTPVVQPTAAVEGTFVAKLVATNKQTGNIVEVSHITTADFLGNN